MHPLRPPRRVVSPGAPPDSPPGSPLAGPLRRSRRSGAYAVLMSFVLMVLFALTALVVDWGRARIAGAEAQAIADACAQAGVIALKSTGSSTEARAAAQLVTQRNRIAGMEPDLLDFTIGGWDNTRRAWGSGSNAVRVTVGRRGSNAVALPLAALFGFRQIEIERAATAATQNLQVVLVMDVTGSWDKDDFYYARDASVAFLDLLHNAHGDDDVVGMTVFLSKYSWEFTPFTNIEESSRDRTLVRNSWTQLNIGSFSGVYMPSWEADRSKDIACKVYATGVDNFRSPPGGCFPDMPRYYSDENGTDHVTGMQMAKRMFEERADPFAYRAMVVLTDGKPNGYTQAEFGNRRAAGYSESRFREYQYPSDHTNSQIKGDTVALAEQMYRDDGVNTWFVSFVAYDAFMESASQGDGYFRRAGSASELVEIFEQIARSLPVTVVE